MTATRVAAVDCGTNSLRLLVADVDAESGALAEVERRMEIVRLGEDVDRTGVLAPQALERTFAAVASYADRIHELGATRLRFVATSATRDAANRDAFVAGVRARTGVEPEVVSGDEEAALSFTGAKRGLDPRLAAPYLVVDIGGGSTEFIVGHEAPTAARSVDIGCVRLTERHFREDPPAPREVARARDDVEDAIRDVVRDVPLRSAATMVGLAGTVTTVAGIVLGLPAYDPAQIHGAVLTAADVHRTAESLLYMTREKRAAIPVMHPGRVDVIMAGALVLSAVVAYTGLPEIVVSEHDILDGIAWSLA